MIELTFLMLKASASKECDICHYWYLSNYSLRFNQMSAMDVMIY